MSVYLFNFVMAAFVAEAEAPSAVTGKHTVSYCFFTKCDHAAVFVLPSSTARCKESNHFQIHTPSTPHAKGLIV